MYYYLLPSGKVSDTAKAVFSVITAAAVCIPLFGLTEKGKELIAGFGIREATEIYEPYSYYAAEAQRTIDEKVSLTVRKYTDGAFWVESDIHISEDMCIDIEHITVSFETYPERLHDLSEELEELLGIRVEFKRKENDDDQKNNQ